jgi:hypothetical protein
MPEWKNAPWLPAAASVLYPGALWGFHQAAIAGRWVPAAVLLAAAFALPLACLGLASRPSLGSATRRMAFAAVAAPPLYVLVGVVSGLLHSPVPDWALWIVAWFALGLPASLAGSGAPSQNQPWSGRLRVVHGVAGALILLFVAFHLSNHLLGLGGAELHGRVMRLGRAVYRSRWIEPLLVALMLFQVGVGVRLAWRWSAGDFGPARALQVGSGVYLAAFILTHMNSALVSARTVHGLQTDWAWATGAPTGLLLDAWNIRLLPHYALGVFFVVAHLFCGLRVVLLGHGVAAAAARRVWFAGLVLAAGLSAAISSALCGLRI